MYGYAASRFSMFFLAQVKDSRSRRKIMDIIALDLNKAALEPGRRLIPAFADGIRGNPQRNRRKNFGLLQR